ncbi:MAG: hypothetical protein WAL98_18260 [Desulfatiglandaceae bacterium]
MGVTFSITKTKWKSRLRSFKGLALAFLIHTKHQGIFSNDNYTAAAPRTDFPKVFKERMECHGVEPSLLSLQNQFPVAQPYSTKVAPALSCGMVQQHRVLLLRGYPHQAARSISLKMDFIGRPEIDSLTHHELSKSFYMPPELQDWLGQ